MGTCSRCPIRRCGDLRLHSVSDGFAGKRVATAVSSLRVPRFCSRGMGLYGPVPGGADGTIGSRSQIERRVDHAERLNGKRPGSAHADPGLSIS